MQDHQAATLGCKQGLQVFSITWSVAEELCGHKAGIAGTWVSAISLVSGCPTMPTTDTPYLRSVTVSICSCDVIAASLYRWSLMYRWSGSIFCWSNCRTRQQCMASTGHSAAQTSSSSAPSLQRSKKQEARSKKQEARSKKQVCTGSQQPCCAVGAQTDVRFVNWSVR